jgi:microcin C transport system permease protein
MHGTIAYFIRRFLLIIPTFIGITMLSFGVMQFVPGGPVEQMIMSYQMSAAGGEAGGAGSGGLEAGGSIPEEALEEIKKFYGFDKPVLERYFKWLFNVCTLNLGESYRYSEPVWQMISERFPVSIYFGAIGFMLSYSVCIPLGVWKAVKHTTSFDTASSVIVFIGYSIPGWAAGIVLLTLFGGGSFWDVFPLGEMHSPPELWETMTFGEQVIDQIHHTVLPVFCYMIGQFAGLTVLMKNSLMENLGADYVRTAFAKGLSEKVVVFKHALRNSMIPIATGLGRIFSLILAGSYLIEKVFNIDGIGMLGYSSIVERDYPVALGILVIASLLKLVGNIIADMLYCIIDPRIRFS